MQQSRVESEWSWCFVVLGHHLFLPLFAIDGFVLSWVRDSSLAEECIRVHSLVAAKTKTRDEQGG